MFWKLSIALVSKRGKEMRKVLTFVLIFTGAVATVLMLNIVMFAFIPSYHDALVSLVAGDEEQEIPVVVPDTEVVVEDINLDNQVKEIPPEPVAVSYQPEVTKISVADTIPEQEDVKTQDDKPQRELDIISREYHEDCGTGKGYWVLTYEDGSVVIE